MQNRIGEIPIAEKHLTVLSSSCETHEGKTPLTLAELIESGYRACGKRRASGIIRLAAKARLIVFQERARLQVS